MTFHWDKFYDVGVCLSNISEKEEYQRSAVGRYYYAAFGLVKEYYEEKYHRFLPKIDSHAFLIDELKKSYGYEETLGKKLRRIRTYRNFADYDKVFYQRNVRLSEETYKEIIEILNNLNEDL